MLWADARIDNRAELFELLGTPASSASGLTDAGLIVRAYRKWREAAAEKLIGDFAFALWDHFERRLFCARDHFGVRPFYYTYQKGRVFRFSSSLESLLEAPEVSPDINERRIADFLARVCIDRSDTFYSRISRLPAGHWLTLEGEQLRIVRYWRLTSDRELKLRSDAEYAEVFRDAFVQAVRCRLRDSGAPIATTLSGGLDSSSIACTARHLLSDSPHTLYSFSAVFPGLPPRERKRADERNFIEQVLAGGSIRPHSVEADRLSPLTELDQVLRHQSEPFYAPNLYVHWALYRAAAGTGARVFLDGLDGDSAVSDGIDLLTDLARTMRWGRLLRESAALSRRSAAKPGTWNVAWQYGVFPALQHLPGFRGAARRTPPPGCRIVNAAFARRTKLRERVAAAFPARNAVTSRQKHIEGLDGPVHQMGLESCYRAAAAFGLEARYPFFDRRLLELSVAIPSTQKLRNGWTRMILRRAMEGILPPAIQWRFTKADLSPNFVRGFAGPDCPLIREVVLYPPDQLGEYVDLQALRSSFDRFVSRPAGAPSEMMDLYTAVILAQWLQKTHPRSARENG